MSESNGCSTGVVVLVAGLMLVLGLAVGGAVVWFQMPSEVLPATTTTTTTVTTVPPQPKLQTYAALLPLEETLRIEGPLAPEDVKGALLGGKRFKLRDCYQEGVKRNPDLKGEMSLQFTVAGSNGAVIAAIERYTNFSDSKVSECILKEIRSWKFPPQKGQSVVKFDVLMMSMAGNDAPQAQ